MRSSGVSVPAHVQSRAGTAEALALPVARVVFSEQVASPAFGSVAVVGGATPKVLSAGDCFEVGGSYADRVPAQMVKFHACGDGTVDLDVAEDVGNDRSTFEPKLAVCELPFTAMNGCGPFPTTTRSAKGLAAMLVNLVEKTSFGCSHTSEYHQGSVATSGHRDLLKGLVI